jgi:preprotein translocase subunit SecG
MLFVMIVNICILALFILLGLLFASGKGADLIAGYNTMSAREKEKYDKKKLCKAMAKLMFVLGACWAVLAAGLISGVKWLNWVGMALFFVAAIVGVILMNKNDNKFRK